VRKNFLFGALLVVAAAAAALLWSRWAGPAVTAPAIVTVAAPATTTTTSGSACPEGYSPNSTDGMFDFTADARGPATPEAAVRASAATPAGAVIVRSSSADYDYDAVLDGKVVTRYGLHQAGGGGWLVHHTHWSCYPDRVPSP
jgi:hypothetical protein